MKNQACGVTSVKKKQTQTNQTKKPKPKTYFWCDLKHLVAIASYLHSSIALSQVDANSVFPCFMFCSNVLETKCRLHVCLDLA